MENIFDKLESIRETVHTLAYFIEQVDDLTKNIVESRWKYELLRRDASLGAVATPRGPQMVTAEQMKAQYEKLARERTVAEAALMDIVGVSSVDAARAAYLNLVTHYQRVGSLRELERMDAAGFPKAHEEMAAQDFLSQKEIEMATIDAADAVIAIAASIQIKPISEIALVR